MPYYELLCLAHGQLSRKQLADLVTRTARSFMSLGGVVTRLHGLGADGHGARKLAYRIRRSQTNYTTGYFVNICAFASPAALKEVCRRLSLEDGVLRMLSVRKPVSEATADPPDINRSLPSLGIDRSDPAFALHEFLDEYGREFPDGQKIVASEEIRELDYVESKSDAAVKAVLSNLKASANATQGDGEASRNAGKGSDPGLKWLLDFNGEPKSTK